MIPTSDPYFVIFFSVVAKCKKMSNKNSQNIQVITEKQSWNMTMCRYQVFVLEFSFERNFDWEPKILVTRQKG